MESIESIRSSLERLKFLKTQIEGQLKGIDESIASMEKLLKIFDSAKEIIIIDDPVYPPKGSWSDKILHILSTTLDASPFQLALLLKDFEKSYSDTEHTHEHLLNITSQYLPKMYKDGLIDREKDGRAFKYKVKK